MSNTSVHLNNFSDSGSLNPGGQAILKRSNSDLRIALHGVGDNVEDIAGDDVGINVLSLLLKSVASN